MTSNGGDVSKEDLLIPSAPSTPKRFRYWLSAKLAYWALIVHPTAGTYRKQHGTKYHVGPGGKCPNDPEWT